MRVRRIFIQADMLVKGNAIKRGTRDGQGTIGADRCVQNLAYLEHLRHRIIAPNVHGVTNCTRYTSQKNIGSSKRDAMLIRFHIEMPSAPYIIATLDAHFLCGELSFLYLLTYAQIGSAFRSGALSGNNYKTYCDVCLLYE